MGNRALRVKVAKLIKEWGLGKLYYGRKLDAYRSLSANVLRNYVRLFSIKPGSVVGDCDGFNHIIKKPLIDYIPWHGKTRVRVIVLDQFEFEDGRRSCGCSSGILPARTAKQIESYFAEGFADKYVARSKEMGWWNEKAQLRYEALKSGKPICDERGIELDLTANKKE